MGSTNTNINSNIEVGLPNIKGKIDASELTNGGTFTEAFFNAGRRSKGSENYDGGNSYNVGFDASFSNPIFGSSTTVQPPAIMVKYYIQAYNKVKIEESTRNLIENVNTNTANINALNTVISDIKSNVDNMMANNLFMPDWNSGIDITSEFIDPENTTKAYTVPYDAYIIAWTYNTYIYLYFKPDCVHGNTLDNKSDRNYVFMTLDNSSTLTSNHAYCPGGTTLYMDKTTVVNPKRRTNNVI
jgi:hypothetical protein